MFKRGGVFYLEDGVSGRQHSLKTRSRPEAERLWHARNEAAALPALNLAMARAYLSANDPNMLACTWQTLMDEFSARGKPQTQALRRRKLRHRTLNPLRGRRLLKTTSEELLLVLRTLPVMVAACPRIRGLHGPGQGP